jgi:hypothetical protein
VPSDTSLGEVDEQLKKFIVDTARRRAAQTTRLPDIIVLKSPDAQLAAAQVTVRVLYRSSPTGTLEVRDHVIRLQFQRVPKAGCTLDIPSIFEIPVTVPWTATDLGGHDQDMQRRTFRVLDWISAHTLDRIFEPGSLDSYVEFLKRLACLGSSFDQEVPGHGGIYGGNNLFTISKAEAGYLISPSADVVSHISSGSLPGICVVDGTDALLRAIERLETVYLATGYIESA